MGIDAAIKACSAIFLVLAPVHETLARFSNSTLIIHRREGVRADGDSEITSWREGEVSRMGEGGKSVG